MSHVIISIDRVAAAAVLADAVRDADGQVLLAAGMALSVGLIESLRRRGVTVLAVAVAGDSPASDPHVLRERAAERVRHLFRHTLQSGAVNPLLYLVPRYRLEGKA